MKKGLIGLLLVLSIVLSGCASKEANENYDYDPMENNYSDTNTQQKSPDPVVEEPTEQGGNVIDSQDTPTFENRKIIYRADLEMAVASPNTVYNNVLDTIANYTAYVEEADITYKRYAVTIRVLSSEFDQLIEDIETEGDIVSFEKTSEDVTNAYSIFEAHYEALEARHTRILELIATAEDLNTILLLEEERADIEAELNQIGNTLANYDSLVDYSTITLLIREAVEEIIVLPRTEAPILNVQEISKNTIVAEFYNHSDENVTLHVDLYKNGEFVEEYEENLFADSKTVVTFDELKSNSEYTIKYTTIASEHRISLQDLERVETLKTYGNKTTNTFLDSINLLVTLFEYLGLMIVGLLPFVVTGAVIIIPTRMLYRRFRKHKVHQISPIDEE